VTRVLLLVALLLGPVVVYWQTVFHEYGFRDDYAHLREVRDEPGKLTRLTASNGRPVYGVVLEASLRHVYSVPDLSRLRLTSVVLLAVVGVALWQLLRRRGWSEGEAAAIGIAVTFLPGAQVVVGWAIAWPIALGLLAAVLGFWFVDAHLGLRGPRAAAGLLGGAGLYFVAGLVYQTSALFAVALLAAVLLTRRDDTLKADFRFVTLHIGILFVSLVAGYVLMTFAFTEGVVPEAARMHLEPELLTKLGWFLRQPLPNSLALFELRDRFATQPQFWVALGAFAALVALGYRYGGSGAAHKRRWWFCLLALPFVAHSVSIAASSQAIGYRTVLPLSGLFLVLVVFGLRGWRQAGGTPARVAAGALAALVVFAAVLANRNSFTLIAVPQHREWQLVRSSAYALPLDASTSVYIVRPQIEDRSTDRVYADEFGSLSADADWAAKEMFKTAMRQRFQGRVPDGSAYAIYTGLVAPPAPGRYDLVLDMRALRISGQRALAAAASTVTSLR
jgi:hypothetical protein